MTHRPDLKRLDITAQRPYLEAVKQDPAALKQWLREGLPAIRAEAEADGAVVYLGDESNLRSGAHTGTIWGIKGETPVVPKTGRRFSLNLLSAVSPRAELRFMVNKQRVNAETFTEFLRRRLVNAERPIYLVLDGHPVHRLKKVRQCVERQAGRLKLFTLPPSYPELNPGELVWNLNKRKVSGRTTIESQDAMRRLVCSALPKLQRSTETLKRLFHEKRAADVIDERRV